MPPPSVPAEAETALRRFRQFYQELFTIRRLLSESDWAALTGGRPVAGGMEEVLLRAVQQRLRRAIVAQGFGGTIALAAPAGVDPGYVMAALADETLLHEVEWPARDAWAETPLEEFLYRSRIAGDRIFQATEALATRRAPDTDGLAMTILLTLEMGFRGRYHGSDDHGEIERLKLVLYELVFRTRYRESDDLGTLIVGASEPLADHVATRLPRLKPWIMATGGVAGAYLLVSWFIWWTQVNGVVATAVQVARSLDAVK